MIAAIFGGVSLLLGLFGFVTLAVDGPKGIGIIGLGCLLAIFARLFQAEVHHKERMKRN